MKIIIYEDNLEYLSKLKKYLCLIDGVTDGAITSFVSKSKLLKAVRTCQEMTLYILKINNEKDLKDLEAKRDKFIAEKTNIDVENLTSWEKNLLQEILAQEAKSISMIFLGKK